MPKKKQTREELEVQASALNLSFVPETTDEELAELIADFEDPKESDNAPDQEQSTDNAPQNQNDGVFSFFKTRIAGLAIALSESDRRTDVGVEEIRFKPYEVWDEKRGEHYRLGLLKTEEPDAIEILSEDTNVQKITKAEYEKILKDAKEVAY